MAIDVTHIEEGIEVRGWDGARIGIIHRVWVDDVPHDSENVETSGYFDVALYGAEKYEVEELYVPFSAITACVPGDSVKIDFSYRPESECYRSMPRMDEW